MITFHSKGNFKRLDNYFERLKSVIKVSNLDKYGKLGVEALSAYTPIDSGETAEDWYYTIERNNGSVAINYCNSNTVNGTFHVAVMLQYGHGVKGGGWVEGVDYINPALRPIFESIAKDAWKEVTGL